MYRMQIFDRNTTGMHWHIHKDGAHHYHEYLKEGKRMEVAVAIGTDPAVTYSATAPVITSYSIHYTKLYEWFLYLSL